MILFGIVFVTPFSLFLCGIVPKTLSERRRCIFYLLMIGSARAQTKHKSVMLDYRWKIKIAVLLFVAAVDRDLLLTAFLHNLLIYLRGIGRCKHKLPCAVALLPCPFFPVDHPVLPKFAAVFAKLWRNYPDAASKAQQSLNPACSNRSTADNLHRFSVQRDKHRKISSVFLLFYRSNFVLLLKLFPDALHRIVFRLLFWSADHQRQNARLFGCIQFLVKSACFARLLGDQTADVPLTDHRKV